MTAFEVVTLFPELVQAFATMGIVGRAGREGSVEIHATNPREFTHDRHRTVDDVPFGGGAGMVLKLEPVRAALASLEAARGPTRRILLTPTGRPFTQRDAERLRAYPRIALLCGRYEGMDDRIRADVDEAISLGDFVLNGGEVAAMAIIEAISRLGEGVLHNPHSARDDSFTAVEGQSLGPHLEHPHYTRPPALDGQGVPRVLLRGDHARVIAWRTRAALVRTWAVRPELRPRWVLSERTPVCVWVARGGEALVDIPTLARAGITELCLECTLEPSPEEPTLEPNREGRGTDEGGTVERRAASALVAAAIGTDVTDGRAMVRVGESLGDVRRRRRRAGRGEPAIVILREGAPILGALDPRRFGHDGAIDVGEGVEQPVVDRVAPLLDLLALGRSAGAAKEPSALAAVEATTEPARRAAEDARQAPTTRAAMAEATTRGAPLRRRPSLDLPGGLILVVTPDLVGGGSAPIAGPAGGTPGAAEFALYLASPRAEAGTHPEAREDHGPEHCMAEHRMAEHRMAEHRMAEHPMTEYQMAHSAQFGPDPRETSPDDLAHVDLGGSSLAFVARMIDASRPRWPGGATPHALSAAIASLVGALRRTGREPPPSEFTP